LTVGERLTRGRRECGLSIADVSSRTQIRPNVVDCIEHDDFSACVDDVEARAEIRAIAEVIGLPAQPLVDEFEATGPIAATTATDQELADESTEPIPALTADQPVMPPEATYGGEPVYADEPAEPVGFFGAMSGAARRARGNAFVLGGIALLAVAVLGGCLLAFGLGGSATSGQPRRHDASHTPTGHSPGHSSRHRDAQAGNGNGAHVLRPVHIAAFGPGGVSDGDHPQLAHLVVGGHASRPWHSSWYSSPRFGDLQAGTGLVLDMGREVTVRDVRIVLGKGRGANLELRVGNALTLSRLQPVARATGAARVVRMRAKPRGGRYVLVWFTRLPSDRAGTFQASVYKVTLLGR